MSVAQSTGPNSLDKVPNMAADYTPSDDLKAAIRAFEEIEKLYEQGRESFRKAIGRELLEHPEATAKKLATHVPWSDETVRGIAREFDVPLKRPPTVRSIKDKPES